MVTQFRNGLLLINIQDLNSNDNGNDSNNNISNDDNESNNISISINVNNGNNIENVDNMPITINQNNVNNPNLNVINYLQIIFSNLLKSEKAFASTKEFCQNYLDWEGNPINPLFQMDAFEFFNTLFDKLENFPILKNLTQDLFGGSLINQISTIKTNYCSERKEQLYAISLDVIRKKDIYDSFDQYIESEILQGDNQYYLEELGKKVDAKKRVFIKTLPKNLILHLKRFEYDMRTQQRYKVNDYFEFPMKLNMFKYTKEGILNEERGNGDNIDQKDDYKPLNTCYDYELVGILVHRGNTEAGHYYSYIKDRSSTKWYEFNDEMISDFNQNNIPEQCFGEDNNNSNNNNNNNQNQNNNQNNINYYNNNYFQKDYSAYMLFYQRVDIKDQNIDIDLKNNQAIRHNNNNNNNNLFKLNKLNVIQNVLQDNLVFLRRKQIFNEEYFKFMDQLFQNSNNNLLIKLSFQFFIKFFLHSSKKPGLNKWISKFESVLRNNHEISKWFIENLFISFNNNYNLIKSNITESNNNGCSGNFNHNDNDNDNNGNENNLIQDINISTELTQLMEGLINKRVCSKENESIINLFYISFETVFQMEKKQFNQDIETIEFLITREVLEFFNQQNYSNISNLIQGKLKNKILINNFQTLSAKYLYYILTYLNQPISNWIKLEDVFKLFYNLIRINNKIKKFVIKSRIITLLLDHFLSNYSPFNENNNPLSEKSRDEIIGKLSFFPQILYELLTNKKNDLGIKINNNNDNNDNNNNIMDNEGDNDDDDDDDDLTDQINIDEIDISLLIIQNNYQDLFRNDTNDKVTGKIIETLVLKENLTEIFFPVVMDCLNHCDSTQLDIIFNIIEKIVLKYPKLVNSILEQSTKIIIDNFQYKGATKVSIITLKKLTQRHPPILKWYIKNSLEWISEFLIKPVHHVGRNLSQKFILSLLQNVLNPEQFYLQFFKQILNSLPNLSQKIYQNMKKNQRVKTTKSMSIKDYFKLTSYFSTIQQILKLYPNFISVFTVNYFQHFWELFKVIFNHGIPNDNNQLSLITFLKDNLTQEIKQIFLNEHNKFDYLLEIELGFGYVSQEFNEIFLSQYYLILIEFISFSITFNDKIRNSKNLKQSIQHVINNQNTIFNNAKKTFKKLIEQISDYEN